MNVVAFDTETRGLEWFNPDHRAFLVSWTEGSTSHVGRTDDPATVAAFRAALEAADLAVAHNLPFDVHHVRESMDIDLLRMGIELLDTDLLARIVLPQRSTATDEEGRGYKLKDLATTYLRADAKAAEDRIESLAKSLGITLKSTGGYYAVWRAYPLEMQEYALLDAEYARDLLPILEAKLDDCNRQCWGIERELSPILIAAEQRGVKVDQAVVERLRAQYEPLVENAADIVKGVLGEHALDGRDALLEALLAHEVPLYKRTPSGLLATNKFALQEFESDYPVLKTLGDWRKAEKMLSTYIDPLSRGEVVHPSFWQCGAWTGRMSCSSPNMQNLPARGEQADTKLREVFVPRDGYCFIAADYDSVELRLLAYYLNDQDFRDKVRDGFDTFAWLASEVENDGHPPAYYEKGQPGEKKRSAYKNVTYAITYGAGNGRISDMLNLDPGPFATADHYMVQKGYKKVGDPLYAAGAKVVNKIKNTLPRYMELASTRRPQGRVPRAIEARGYVTTLLGRKQVVKRDKAYVGLNALIQGSAADLFKQGIINATRAIEHLGAAPVLFVHDELVVECPLEHAEECKRLVEEAMCASYDLDPPLAVSGSICLTNYSEGK